MGGPAAIVAFGQRAAPADFAREVPRVLRAEAAGDPAARAIMGEAEAAVAAAIDRLQADGPLPVCFLGGLGPEFAGRLAARYPGMIRPPQAPGSTGRWPWRGGWRDALQPGELCAGGRRAALPTARPAHRRGDRERGAGAGGEPALRARAGAATGLSRVTVRRAVEALVAGGELVRRRGSGTFVAPRVERVEQALSLLTSFSEDMARRGKAVRSVWLARTVQAPSPEEMMALGLTAYDRVARLERVRLADEVPLAIERAALPTAVLPDPAAVGGSLYAVLAERGLRPVRAVQRIRRPTSGRGTRSSSGCRWARRGCASSGCPTSLRDVWWNSPARSIVATRMTSRPSCRSRPRRKGPPMNAETPTHMSAEVAEIPAAAARFLEGSRAQIAAAAAAMRAADPRLIVTVARGSSDHAASYLKYAAEIVAGVRWPRSGRRSRRSTAGSSGWTARSASGSRSRGRARTSWR